MGIHLVPAILETGTRQLVEELVNPGQNKNLMSIQIPKWESTTTAGTLLGILKESGATPLDKDKYRPANLSIALGFDPFNELEFTGRVSRLNIFNSALSIERMVAQTTAGGEECGAPGDLVNWEEAEWTLHS